MIMLVTFVDYWKFLRLMLVLPIKQQMCPADFHHHQYQSSEPHHVHLARVHYCCVTGDRNLNCAVYTVSNVADDDANTYIYYTFIILHYTVRISLFTRPRAPPRFRDASSSGAGLILVTTTISVLRSCRVVSLRRQHVELFILCDAEQSMTMMFQHQQQQQRRRRRRLAHVCVCTLHAEMLNRQ